MRLSLLVLVSSTAWLACVASAQIGGSRPQPAWSPDGARVLAAMWVDAPAVVCHEPATERSQLVLQLTDPADLRWYHRAAFAWTTDGGTAIVAHHADTEPPTVAIHCLPVPALGATATPRRFTLASCGRRVPISLLVRGDTLFVGAGDLVSVDLLTGKERRRTAASAGSAFAVHAAGERVAYTATVVEPQGEPFDSAWELGWLDADELTTTRVLGFAPRGDAAPREVPWPAFASDSAGIAVPVQEQGSTAWSIRIYRGDVLVTTLPVLPAWPAVNDASTRRFGQTLGDVAWLPGDTAIVVGSERFDDRSYWSLWNVPLDGTAPHETSIWVGAPTRCIGACNPPRVAVAANGTRVAFVTSMLQALVLDRTRQRIARVEPPVRRAN
jgi:hypothetical protein